MNEQASTLADRYELLEVIGSGGMAAVWLADDRALRRRVAVKVLLTNVSEDPSFQKRLEREARHIASMSHPNIVTVYDFGRDGDRLFIVMEYVEGQSLRQILKSDRVLSLSATAALAVATLSALAHAHERGIVHRDMKPGNILVSSTGSTKVADFGVAKSSNDTTELTIQGAFVGTAAYASPEQLMGRSIGPASDLYSLGCVLYQCLAGRPPFEADDLERLVLQHRVAEVEPIGQTRPEVPEKMVSAINHALEKDPLRRFGTAQQMREEFAPFAGGGRKQLALITASRDSRHSDDTVAGRRSTETAPDTAIVDERGLTADPIRSAGQRSPLKTRRPVRRIVAGVVILLGAATLVALLVLWSLDRGGNASKIPSGGILQAGQFIESPNGHFKLAMQPDGNLVEYAQPGGSPIWESATSGNFGAYAVAQVDGDFVVYPKGKSAPPQGQPTPALWSSGSFGHPGSYVELRDNGDTVLLKAGSSTVLWKSGP